MEKYAMNKIAEYEILLNKEIESIPQIEKEAFWSAIARGAVKLAPKLTEWAGKASSAVAKSAPSLAPKIENAGQKISQGVTRMGEAAQSKIPVTPAGAPPKPSFMQNMQDKGTKYYNGMATRGPLAQMAKSSVGGAGVGAITYDESKNDGTFGTSMAGKMLGGAAGGAVFGLGANRAMKMIGARPMQVRASWVDNCIEKIAAISLAKFENGRYMTKQDLKDSSSIPGTAQWIKKNTRKAVIEKKASNMNKKKADPFRTTKTVGNVELANHVLNFGTDIAAAGVASAGGFKALGQVIKKNGVKNGLKSAFTSPEFRHDLKTSLKAQKYILPVGAAITAGYVGKALYDDIKWKKHNDLLKTASDKAKCKGSLRILAKSIANETRPDSNYDKGELAKGIKIEHEHTKSTMPYAEGTIIATRIAKDHLDEFPKYYTYLEKMEQSLKNLATRTKE